MQLQALHRSLRDRRRELRTMAVGLAAVVAATALAFPLVSGWPQAYYDLGVVPTIVLEITLPAALAVFALLGAVADGPRIGSTAVTMVALATLVAATSSIYILVTPGDGGVFFGGLITLSWGFLLAAAVLLDAAAAHLGLDATGRLLTAVSQ